MADPTTARLRTVIAVAIPTFVFVTLGLENQAVLGTIGRGPARVQLAVNRRLVALELRLVAEQHRQSVSRDESRRGVHFPGRPVMAFSFCVSVPPPFCVSVPRACTVVHCSLGAAGAGPHPRRRSRSQSRSPSPGPDPASGQVRARIYMRLGSRARIYAARFHALDDFRTRHNANTMRRHFGPHTHPIHTPAVLTVQAA